MPPQSDNPAYDMFISHTTANRDWVNGYLRPALGLSPSRVITADDFRPGTSVVSEFERAVTNSRYSLLVLSPAYLNDEWSTFGEQLASYLSVHEQRDRVVPLLLQQCELPLRVTFRVRLDCTDPANWESEISRVRNLLAQPEPAQEYLPCPYPGMVPFSADDARFFYGRDAEIRNMLLQLRGQRLLFVIGPSGSGKSSLIFAGVLPRLAERSHFPPDYWLVLSMRPGPEPTERLINLIKRPPGQFEQGVQELLSKRPPARRLLLVIDQFEETFTLPTQSSRTSFMAALKKLKFVDVCTLLITMRADFYADLMRSDLWPLGAAERMEIAPLRGVALRQAIEQPANDFGIYLEAGLLERLVADAADEPGALPLVQETMVLLWSQMQRRLLPLSAYDQLGSEGRSGLAVAIATKADATTAISKNFSPAQHAVARRIFLRLVQFGEGRLDTRRQQRISALRSEGEDPELFNSTLTHLTENRLLTLSGEETRGEKVVDIAHEALISGWPSLRKWLSERRSAEQTRRRLENKAAEWGERVRDNRGGGLLDMVELTEAEHWIQSSDGTELGSSAELVALIRASREQLEEEERAKEAVRRQELESAQALAYEQERRAEIERSAATSLRKRAFYLAGAMLLALVLAGFSYYQYREARKQIPIAKSRQLAAQADAHLNDRLDIALLLGVEAYKRYPTFEARKAMLTGLRQSPRAIAFLHIQHGSVQDVRFGNDNKTLLAISEDGTVFRWDVQTLMPIGVHTKGPPDNVQRAVLSPDGTVAALVVENQNILLWNTSTGERRGETIKTDIGSISGLAFSADGTKLAVVSYASNLSLFDLQTHRIVGQPIFTNTRQRVALSVAFSQDGNTVAVSGSGSAVDRMDVKRMEWIGQPLKGNNWWANAVAYSPDGETIATGNRDGTISKWRKQNITPDWFLGVTAGHSDAVSKLAFSPDGQNLASGSADGTVSILEESGTKILLGGHGNSVTALAFSSDGKTLASSSQDGRVMLWAISGPHVLGQSYKGHQMAGSIALSPDGKTLATSDGISVSLWDFNERKAREKPLEGKGGTSLTFSGDGKTLISGGAVDTDFDPLDSTESVSLSKSYGFSRWDTVTHKLLERHIVQGKGKTLTTAISRDGKLAFGNEDNTVTIWDSTTGEPPEQLLGGHSGSVRCLAFSLDGKILASGSDDQSIRLWSVGKGTPLGDPLKGHNGPVLALAFSPDGKTLTTGAKNDETVILWDVETRVRRGEFLKGHKGEVKNLAFSPDGGTLASSGNDGPVDPSNTILWDVSTRMKLGYLADSTETPLVFSADGKILLSGGSDGITLWDLSFESWHSRACRIANRNLSRLEWEQFIGNDIPYASTCPNLPTG
jgi:WD40 repeat protein